MSEIWRSAGVPNKDAQLAFWTPSASRQKLILNQDDFLIRGSAHLYYFRAVKNGNSDENKYLLHGCTLLLKVIDKPIESAL